MHSPATFLSESEAIDYLLYELPPATQDPDEFDDPEASAGTLSDSNPKLRSRGLGINDETAPLLRTPPNVSIMGNETASEDDEYVALALSVGGLNALEIAAVVDAKDFLSQGTVQRVIDGIWKGDIVFWTKLSVHATKKAKKYNRA